MTEELEAQKAEYDELLSESDEECNKARASEKEAKDECRVLRQEILSINESIGDRFCSDKFCPLDSYRNIDEWYERNLAGYLWISPKALRETRRSNFEKVELFCNTLILMRDAYVGWRKFQDQKKLELYRNGLRDLKVEDSKCFSNPNDIKGFPEYSVSYRGGVYYCHDHLKYGSGCDGRFMFRIYYHWHEEEQILLIGYMPTHLDNNRTN